MTTTQPSVEITVATPGAYPFGVFSVTPAATPADSHWSAGVWWQSVAGQQVGVTYAPCQVEAPVPALSPNVSCAVQTAQAFTVYARSDESAGGDRLDRKFARAREVLTAGEQWAVEAALWELLVAATPDPGGIAEAGSVREAVAVAEGFMANEYSGSPTIHMSRYTAAMAGLDVLRVDGARLRTLLGSPVIAGGGYLPAPVTAGAGVQVIASGDLTIIRGELFDLGTVIDRSTNQLAAVVERTYVVGWDATAVRVVVPPAP
jgi:hypothetical protein